MPENRAMWPVGLGLLAAYAAVYLVPLGVQPLIVPDETRYAAIPLEMLLTGDWVVPHFDGLRYFEKPPLGYWAVATSIAAFGKTNFAVRLPFALAAGLSALIICWLVRRFGNGGPTALGTSAVFLSSTWVFGLGAYATLDGLLALWITGTMAAYYAGHVAESTWARVGWWALAGVCAGLAFLTKGLVGFAVPGLVVIAFVIWDRTWWPVLYWGWVPFVMALLVVLPWGVAIHLREPDFWNFFIWNEHIRRFSADNAQHAGPFYYYVPVLLIGAFPWALAGLDSLVVHLKRRPWDRLTVFAVLWLAVPFVFFSLSRGKLPTYVLPCFAPFAILIATALVRGLNAGRYRGLRIGADIDAVLAGIVFVGFAVVQLAGIRGAPYAPDETAKWLLPMGLGTMALIGLLVAAGRAKTPTRSILSVAAAPLALMLAAHWVLPQSFIERKMPVVVLDRYADRVGPDTILIAEGNIAGAVSWAYGRNDIYIYGGRGEFEYGLGYSDSAVRFLPLGELAAFLAEHRDGPPVVMILKGRDHVELNDIPAEVVFENDDPYFVFLELRAGSD